MNITAEQLDDLFELQACSLRKNQAQKEFDALPQRQAILTIRQKKEEILKKAAQVGELLKQAKAEVSRIHDEDEKLAAREKDKQAEIEEKSENFRQVAQLSKELEAIHKQRAKLSGKLDPAMEQLEKVQGVAAQMAAAMKALEEKEAAEVASFRAQGAALQKELVDLADEYTNLEERIPADVMAEFKKIADRNGGVALGKLEGGRCGCCRTPIDGAHMAALRADAPLAKCPNCKRMLVVG